MAEETTTDERMREREELLAALDAADTPASEKPRESGELAPDSQEADKPETTPAPEVEAEAPSTDGAEVKAEGEEQSAEDAPTKREKKSNERLNKGWDKFNSEREAFKQEKEAFEKAKQEYSDDQTSPDEYRELATRYKEEGEDSLAELAEEKAREVEQRRAERKETEAAEGVQAEWSENLKDLQEQYPDLKDAGSEMSRGVEHILNQRPAMRNHAHGIQDAVEFVNSKIMAKGAEALAKTNGDLQAEIDELKKQTSVSGSPPERESSPKSLDDQPREQVREKLLAALQHADESQQGLRIFR